jgi:rSAM/selenodomain-associated transferase 1
MAQQLSEFDRDDTSIKSQIAIGIFIKAPRPGLSKTRLCPPLTPSESATLSRCFLRDTSENISAIVEDRKTIFAVYTPLDSEREFKELLVGDFRMLPQRGESLGERLHNACSDIFEQGFNSVCLLGSDSPTLPGSYLRDMIVNLGRLEQGVVIGPTLDGGYYGIGLKAPQPRLFAEIDWSTKRVFEQTRERLSELTLPWTALPAWYDVDDGNDLEQLLKDLYGQGDPNRSASPYSAPHTRAVLESILSSEGSSRIWPNKVA